MRIVADRNIPGLSQTFGRHGEIVLADGRSLARTDLKNADALIVRSVSAVNSALLSGSSVRFVGTTTIGIDHLDTAWLDQAGIHWVSAPGCNADGAAQYSVAMTLLACARRGIDVTACSIGIVGCGNVGRRARALFQSLHVRELLACDPLLAAAGEPGLCELDELSDCEVITLHVPLTRGGEYPTYHMIDINRLGQFRPGTLVVNTSRGNVADGSALLEWLDRDRGAVALDVWPGEPAINGELLSNCTVATPHVAGYSLDGKLNGTSIVYLKFCDWLGVEANAPDLLSGIGFETLPANASSAVVDAILAACPVERDDLAMRRLLAVPTCQRASRFDELRAGYPQRRDFAGWTVPSSFPKPVATQLRALGFH